MEDIKVVINMEDIMNLSAIKMEVVQCKTERMKEMT